MPLNEQVGRPLVTISMSTYNQEKYVRDSVRGLLSQTYEPLKIVISDDCSTDNTWRIITEEVERYRKSGGIHTDIVLNRNDINLGIALHSAKIGELIRGAGAVIKVGQGGDDISLPNRVERIVETWQTEHPAIILHNAIKIDVDGNAIGTVSERVLKGGVFGALSTYSVEAMSRFEPITEPLAYEDQIYSRRCRMFGKLSIIREPLIKYRVGSGVSTIQKNFRLRMARCIRAELASWRQTAKDVEWVKNELPNADYARYRNEAMKSLAGLERYLYLWESDSFSKRLFGFGAIGWRRFCGRSGVVAIILLLPHSCSDAILDFFLRVTSWIKRSWYQHCEKGR